MAVTVARIAEYWSNRNSYGISSYKGRNTFYYEILIKLDVTRNTPKIKADLKEFAVRVLPHFKKYDIPHLNCEILGYHLKNLSSFIGYRVFV